MITLYISFVIIALAASLTAYLTTLNILITLLVLLSFVLYFVFIARKQFIKFYSTISRVHSSYFFINTFIVTLSVKGSYDESLQNATKINDPKLNLYLSQLKNLTASEKVRYLSNYFELGIYKMFLNILGLYEDQGGNILFMADNVINEATRVEKTLNDSLLIGRKHLIEFIILWAMAFGVLLFIRFGVSEFYLKMLSSPIFAPLLFMFFLICLGSIYLFVSSYTNIRIKEDNNVKEN